MAQRKGKATAQANARNRAQVQLGRDRASSRASQKEMSQGRFPGETPLTGEDRPSNRSGGKKYG
jgi:hypothetical protein